MGNEHFVIMVIAHADGNICCPLMNLPQWPPTDHTAARESDNFPKPGSHRGQKESGMEKELAFILELDYGARH
jgi:hypothetical protein